MAPRPSGSGVRRSTAGVTLIEMIIVAALIGILAALSFPGVAAGIDSMRLGSAAASVATFLNAGLNRADRRQHAIEITILPAARMLRMVSPDVDFYREVQLADEIAILAVLPPVPGFTHDAPRQFLIHPAGTVPRLGVVLGNRRGDRRIVSVDPISGVPQVTRPGEAQ